VRANSTAWPPPSRTPIPACLMSGRTPRRWTRRSRSPRSNGSVASEQPAQRTTPSTPGSAEALVAPWRAWLAILTGVGGVLVAALYARKRGAQAAAMRAPSVGLGGLALSGLGLLGGSIATAGVGGVVLLGASAAGALRRGHR